MQYYLGRFYWVSCAKIEYTFTKQIAYIPILGKPHADPQFGTNVPHYHIDGRFTKTVEGIFTINELGKTNDAVFFNNEHLYKILDIVKRLKKCRNPSTGMKLHDQHGLEFLAGKYKLWADTFNGKSVVNNKCPHRGVDMILENNILRCPLHDLHACPITKVIIPHPMSGVDKTIPVC